MSSIVLSASVRQNLLSLQSTADLLATTQNRLATGNKVNTALDNPTNYFTALSLNNRSSDISNLLDGVSNGVQVLQAANTGITSLQKLIDSAKSVANQALQAPVGYSTKSSVTTAAISGATSDNLLGTATYSSNTVTGSAVNNNLTSPVAITGATKLVSASNSDTLATTPADGSKITVNGVDITFSTAQTTKTGNATTGFTIGVGAGSTLTVQDVLSSIDAITGTSTAASITAGKITLDSGTNADLVLSGTALGDFGLTAGTTARTQTGGLANQTLTIGATGSGTATSITFGTGAGQVKSLNDLNTALASNNLLATLDSATGKITITTTNDAASSTIGAIGGTAAGAGFAFNGLTAGAPVKDAAAQLTRSNLVDQYNNILDQIKTTAQDASFNGIDLLNGDQLKLTFNETGTSTLKIQGVTFDYSGLGLSKLTGGTDFLDNSSANSVLSNLDTAASSLRTEASALGSNLSIVQIRQDFSKNLINVMQTGASNLTLADTNEEAANSQALSTRQSIAVSALSLANQSQQSVLRLLQ